MDYRITLGLGISMMIGSAFGLILAFGLDRVTLNSRQKMYVGFPSELFIQALKGIAIPLISSCFIIAISNFGKELSLKLRCRLVTYILFTKIETILLGFGLAIALRPGKGYKYFNKFNKKFIPNRRDGVGEIDEILDIVRNIFPDNWALTTMKRAKTMYEKESSGLTYPLYVQKPINLLGIMSVCFFIGISIRMLKRDSRPLRDFLICVVDVSVTIMKWILFTSPLFLISLVGHETLQNKAVIFLSQVAMYTGASLAGFLFQIALFYPLIFLICVHGNPYIILQQNWNSIKTGALTSSSREAIPDITECLKENSECDEKLVDYALPIITVINKDGTSFMFALSFVVIAQASGIDLQWHDYTRMAILCLIGSIAVVGVPHGWLIIKVIMLQSVELHVPYVCILFSVDWLLDRIQTTNNIIGNAYCMTVMNRVNRKLLQEWEAKLAAVEEKPEEIAAA